jgi:dTDP-4-dehydrorhamnose reductase
MKIMAHGARGTMGAYLSNAFEKEHEVVRADRKSPTAKVDISSPAAIEDMYKKVGAFDGLIFTAGPTYVGPGRT